jgi:Ni,Fe-hydrogenase I large subunit
MGFPIEETRSSAMLNDVVSEFKLFPLQVMIGNESDDDLMVVNTLRSFDCCSRCRTSVR